MRRRPSRRRARLHGAPSRLHLHAARPTAAGNYADAERHFDAALESNLENRHEVVCTIALRAMKLGKYADAVADASEATYLEPTYVKAHYRLACAQRALGKFDRALKAARAGLELQPASTQLSSFIKEVEEEAAAARACGGGAQSRRAQPENEHKACKTRGRRGAACRARARSRWRRRNPTRIRPRAIRMHWSRWPFCRSRMHSV